MALDVLTRRRASPLKVISTIWMFVPLFCILVFLFNRSTPYPSSALGPEDKTTVHHVNWTNAIPPPETAYAYTFFGGRYDDTQRFVATLTSIEALRRTNTERDIVVVVNDKIQPGQIETLKTHGVIVHTMKDQDLFQSQQNLPLGSYCYSNFAPIYAWSLTQYERVVWLDADVLPQMNMDELFLCGEFCLTYSNLQWYTTSLIVLKPSAAKITELFDKMRTMGGIPGKLRQQQMEWFPNTIGCQTLFEEFLIQSFYYIESAPLFNPEGTGQQLVPMMRLNMGMALNPIYWYEKYSWDLARGGAYLKMTSNSEFNIPGHSIGYPRAKPYDWLQAIYWNTSWVWTHWRLVLLHESFFGIGVSILSIGVFSLVASLVLINVLFRLLSASSSAFPRSANATVYTTMMDCVKKHRAKSIAYSLLSAFYKLSSFIGLTTTSSLVAMAAVSLTGYVAYTMIPYHTIYYVAWPLFSILLGLFQYSTLAWISAWIFYATHGPDVWIQCNEIIAKQNELATKRAGIEPYGVELTTLNSNGQPGASDGAVGRKLDTMTPYTRAEWEALCDTVELFPKHQNGVILTLVDQDTGSLTPLAQKQLLDVLLDWKAIAFNILLVASVYLINQFQIYPHFAVKIMSMCAGLSFILISFIRPYLSLILIFSYNGWNRAA